jgi:hypothetical protein
MPEAAMFEGRTLFAQLMEFLPWKSFHRIVQRYGGDWRMRRLSCAVQFRCMALGQLTYRASLRDLVACLQAQRARLYHLGLPRAGVHRSTLAEANERRDWRIYAQFAQLLMQRAQQLYARDRFSLALQQTVYALDATTIDLCLALFPWAPFRTTKAAVQLHTQLDLRGPIPSFVHISDGKWREVRMLDLLSPEAGAFYVMDRAYTDFERLYRLDQAGAFFVLRAKTDLDARRIGSQPHSHATVLADQIIALAGRRSRLRYPDRLRRVRVRDLQTGRSIVLLTNHFLLPAQTIGQLYRQRWQVELFFKWIKQHLRIQRFYGCSENAVKTQLWIAISTYLLVAIVRKELRLPGSLHLLLQALSVTLFERIPLRQVLMTSLPDELSVPSNQLILFES